MKVLAIYTGGTIGMLADLDIVPLETLVNYVPYGKQVATAQTNLDLSAGEDLQVDWCGLDELIDSANLTVEHWRQMVDLVADNASAYDGFILLHGTDSMAYTASALSFALVGLNKPLVITGSQLPLISKNSDALTNLTDALRAVSLKIPEVVIAFGGQLIRGNRSRKVHTSDKLAFTSPNYPILAQLGEPITCYKQHWYKPPSLKASIKSKFSNRVVNLFFTSGMSLDVVTQLLASAEIDGYIFHGLGLGNMPTNRGLHSALQLAVGRGKSLLAITQCYQGATNPATYLTGTNLAESGVLDGGDMTPEAATTKMMWALANIEAAKVPSFLSSNLCGERS